MVQERVARKQPEQKRARLSDRSRNILVAAGFVFVMLNLGMGIYYHGRVLPHYYLGRMSVGGKTDAELNTISSAEVLPAKLTLQKGTIRVTQTPAALGIGVDVPASLDNMNSWIRWLPVYSLVTYHHVNIVLHVDKARFNASTAKMADGFSYPAIGKHIVFNGSTFVVAPAHAGYKLNTAKLLASTKTAIQQGKTEFTVPTVKLDSPKLDPDLSGQLLLLQQKLELTISYTYQGHTVHPGKLDMGRWFAASGQSLAPSISSIAAYIDKLGRQFGITVANPNDLATAAAYAVSNNQSLSFAIVPDNSDTIVRTYCTAVDSVSATVLGNLIGKLAATYNDTRGWNDSGHIAFKHVASDCQYTVWLAAANQMTSFGSICDDFYNCQVGTNVILNYDRWTSATPPWNNSGGSLENYHTLMIDHETGHRLGFLDNPTCSGAGLHAPVMMQQSINLKGCVFNVWPLSGEFAQLNQMLGTGQTSSVTNLQ